MSPNDVTLSLIVCTRHRPFESRRLLASLNQQTRAPEETLVIDASSDTRTEAVVSELLEQAVLPGLRYVAVPPEHRGTTRQRNFGAGLAAGSVLCFLDDDALPRPDYFEEIVACFARHPEAVGVSGAIDDVLDWRPVDQEYVPSWREYRLGNWVCREYARTTVLQMLGLGSRLPPGWMPPSAGWREIDYIPPDAADHQIEFCVGASMNWKRQVFDRHAFDTAFSGYALHEDMDLSFQALRDGPLFLTTRARLLHEAAPGGRPDRFRYGVMAVRNGWSIWRRRWPEPKWPDRWRWWAVTTVLMLCRLGDAFRLRRPLAATTEAAGRLCGMASLLASRPRPVPDSARGVGS